MNYNERIVIDSEVRFGKPRIKGTRITVTDVFDYLSGGMSVDEFLLDFPQVKKDDILACFAFAADSGKRIAYGTDTPQNPA
ncbi:MAG: DUF433 domain-containing protein [Rickettsiales bacterium]